MKKRAVFLASLLFIAVFLSFASAMHTYTGESCVEKKVNELFEKEIEPIKKGIDKLRAEIKEIRDKIKALEDRQEEINEKIGENNEERAEELAKGDIADLNRISAINAENLALDKERRIIGVKIAKLQIRIELLNEKILVKEEKILELAKDKIKYCAGAAQYKNSGCAERSGIGEEAMKLRCKEMRKEEAEYFYDKRPGGNYYGENLICVWANCINPETGERFLGADGELLKKEECKDAVKACNAVHKFLIKEAIKEAKENAKESIERAKLECQNNYIPVANGRVDKAFNLIAKENFGKFFLIDVGAGKIFGGNCDVSCADSPSRLKKVCEEIFHREADNEDGKQCPKGGMIEKSKKFAGEFWEELRVCADFFGEIEPGDGKSNFYIGGGFSEVIKAGREYEEAPNDETKKRLDDAIDDVKINKNLINAGFQIEF